MNLSYRVTFVLPCLGAPWPTQPAKPPLLIAESDEAVAFVIVGNDLLQTSRLNEAELVTAEAVRRFPADAAAAIVHALVGQARNEPAEALRRWRLARALAPDNPICYHMPALLLVRGQAQYAAGDVVLAEGLRRAPGYPDLALEYAWSAVLQRDHEEALRRYRIVRERFPHLVAGHAGMVSALRDLGRYDESDAVAVVALPRFPESLELLRAHAWTAFYRKDWSQVRLRWQLLRKRFPQDAAAHRVLGQVLRQHLGAYAEAEQVLAEAVRQFPEDVEIAREYAAVPGSAGNWPEGLRRWQVLSERFPADHQVIAGRGDAELQLRMAGMDSHGTAVVSAVPLPAIPNVASPIPAADWSLTHLPSSPNLLTAIPSAAAPADPARMGLREFFMEFESIGHNCEFGLVQRHFGAEPLGLLRWNASNPAELISALERRFDGLGAPESTEIDVVRGEYLVRDHVYGMGMHTFLMEQEVQISAERLQAQLCRRMAFLRSKLLEDLSTGEKLLVYKCYRTLDDDELARLLQALRRYGNNTLLYVRENVPPERIGLVEAAGPGLLHGYIDRFVQESDGWHTLSVDAWLTVCRNAHALWRDQGMTV